MANEDRPRPDRFTWFLGLGTCVLAVLVLLLARQNRSLKAELSATVRGLPAGALKTGDSLAPFDVIDAAGNKTHVAFGGEERTLLLVFSSTCGACQETLPVWNRLLQEPPNRAVHVIGIQTDFPTEAGGVNATPDLPFPIFRADSPSAEPMTKFPSIPAAALVDGKGTVTAVWFGVPTDAQVSELRRALAG